MRVQRLGQPERLPVAGKLGMCHLPRGMHARVGAARAHHHGSLAGVEPRQRCLDRRLHARQCGLPLPAGERAAVVFELQRVAGHAAAPSAAPLQRQAKATRSGRTAARERLGPLPPHRPADPPYRGHVRGPRLGDLRSGGPPRRHRPQPRRQDGVHHLAGGQPDRPRPHAAAARRRRGPHPRRLPAAAARPHRAALRVRGPPRGADRPRAALAREHADHLHPAPVAAGHPHRPLHRLHRPAHGASGHRRLPRRVAARPTADGPELHRLVRRRHRRRAHARPRPAFRRLAGAAGGHGPGCGARRVHRPRPRDGLHSLPGRKPRGGTLQHGARPVPDAGRPRGLAGADLLAAAPARAHTRRLALARVRAPL